MARAARRANPEGRMSLAEHLRELRNRLLLSCLFVAAAAVVGWYFYEPIVAFISAPVTAVRDAEDGRIVTLNFDNLTGAFAMKMKVAVFTGILLASPVWIWQGWAFLMPGLMPREKRVALSYFFTAIPLFLLGAALAAFSFPRLYRILLDFAPDNFTNIQNANDYLSTAMFFVLAFGLAFLLPVLLVALNQIGILPARTMLRGWRITLFLCLVFSAFMTPDPSGFAMIVMAMPIFVLYWCAVGLSFLLERRKGSRTHRHADLSPDEAAPLS